jgi:hypothetical protein
VAEAYDIDNAQVQQFRHYAQVLSQNVKPLRTYSVNAVSFVSADGGDNRLVFNPAVIELVRVVDSRGNECVLDAIAGTSTLADLEARLADGTTVVVPLRKLSADLAMSLHDMSYLIRSMDDPGKSTGAMRAYRDIVEWAVLYQLATDASVQWGSDTILVRDGLLRTKVFRLSVFPQIDRRLREGTARHLEKNVRLSLVGVAKQSAVLGRLSVALELEGTFHRPYPCYVKVPREVEMHCYNFDHTWLDTLRDLEDPETEGQQLRYQSLGKLYLVKFGDGPNDPVWPVDIAEWQEGEAERILGQLAEDAQMGFPIPDYPMCIQKAHDFAKMGGLEIQVLQDALMDGMCQKLNEDQAERLVRMKLLGQNLADLRYRD